MEHDILLKFCNLLLRYRPAGRYPGDVYAGGNPWQLLTAALGELFYLAARDNYDAVINAGDFPLSQEQNNNNDIQYCFKHFW